MSRGDAIHLDDLADPQFSPEAQPIIDGLTAYGATLTLDAQQMCETASERTGLDTWGDPGFRERLDLYVDAMNNEADLAPHGVVLSYESTVGMLANRLLLEDLIARHPEIEDVAIERPIIICGLPRTGTTHLHNLLSADPALRHLPYWESLEPVLPEAARHEAPDPRLARCAAAVGLVDTVMPHFKRMHEMTVDHAHEEIQLLAIDLSGMFLEVSALMPSWRDHYRATDQTSSYAYLKRVLQAMTWLRGGSRWVLKSPQHLEQFGPLLATFPDATFVVTYRDPVAVTASTCTMLAYGARMRTAQPDVHAYGRYWADRVGDLLGGCLRDRDLLPADRTVDVRLDDFVADELGTVERIYDVAGQPLDAAATAGMEAFVAAHPRGRHGTIRYDLAGLGLDAGELRANLRESAERYDLRDEGLA